MSPDDLTRRLQALDERISALERADSPGSMFALASGSLTVAMAAANPYTQVFCTDLHVPACSNGSHWYRADTGAQII